MCGNLFITQGPGRRWHGWHQLLLYWYHIGIDCLQLLQLTNIPGLGTYQSDGWICLFIFDYWRQRRLKKIHWVWPWVFPDFSSSLIKFSKIRSSTDWPGKWSMYYYLFPLTDMFHWRQSLISEAFGWPELDGCAFWQFLKFLLWSFEWVSHLILVLAHSLHALENLEKKSQFKK